MQCSLDFSAAGTMVAAAAMVKRQIGIRPKRCDDWLMVPNLWGGAVGRPSVLKSPALKVPMDMLSRLEMAAKEDYKRETHEIAGIQRHFDFTVFKLNLPNEFG